MGKCDWDTMTKDMVNMHAVFAMLNVVGTEKLDFTECLLPMNIPGQYDLIGIAVVYSHFQFSI